VNNEPYVASFTFSPARQEKFGGTPVSSKLPENLSRDYKDRQKKRYEYFFDK
jgi:hypothetical protein